MIIDSNTKAKSPKDADFYKHHVGMLLWQPYLGPGSYQLPSIFSEKVKQNQTLSYPPTFSFSRSEKLKFQPTSIPGVGHYAGEIQRNSHVTPAYTIGNSPKEDIISNKQLYKRSPGPVYNFSYHKDIANPHNLSKAVLVIDFKY